MAPDSREALPELLKWQFGHPAIQRAAIRAVTRFGEAAVPDLVKALPNSVALYALPRMGPAARDAIPHLIKHLEPGRKEVPPEVIHALGLFGPDARDAVPPLLKLLALNDSYSKRRYTELVVAALGAIGPDAGEAIPTLAAMLRNPPEDREPVAYGRNTEMPPFRFKLAAALARLDPKNTDSVVVLNEYLEKVPPFVGLRASAELVRLRPEDRERARRLAGWLCGKYLLFVDERPSSTAQ